jgi:hypothetical protein
MWEKLVMDIGTITGLARFDHSDGAVPVPFG